MDAAEGKGAWFIAYCKKRKTENYKNCLSCE